MTDPVVTSTQTAKHRLRLVIANDRLNHSKHRMKAQDNILLFVANLQPSLILEKFATVNEFSTGKYSGITIKWRKMVPFEIKGEQ